MIIHGISPVDLSTKLFNRFFILFHKVRALTMAMDSQRAIVGCDDTRALIFDMHSGRLVRSLPPNPGPATALYVSKMDDFLITAGLSLRLSLITLSFGHFCSECH